MRLLIMIVVVVFPLSALAGVKASQAKYEAAVARADKEHQAKLEEAKLALAADLVKDRTIAMKNQNLEEATAADALLSGKEPLKVDSGPAFTLLKAWAGQPGRWADSTELLHPNAKGLVVGSGTWKGLYARTGTGPGSLCHLIMDANVNGSTVRIMVSNEGGLTIEPRSVKAADPRLP